MTRRPIKTRNTAIGSRVTQWLAGTGVLPDHISMASMVAAALAGFAFYLSTMPGPNWQIVFLLIAAALCQVRLLCNLFDGMLATEGGKGSRAGAVWNEFPDRVADVFILVGVGLAVDWVSLGWAAASMAVLTAYVRELGSHVSGVTDFAGPMAKPQRMAVVTAAAVLTVFESQWTDERLVLQLALWVVTLGAVLTSLLRIRRLLQRLR